MGEMGMHKAGYAQLEMQRRMGMHQGTRTPMSSRAQEYMAKGCQIFLAQISAKKEEDKSEGKQLKDVPIVQDFSKVFPKDLPANSEESLSTPGDRQFIRSTLRIQHLLQDRFEIGLSPAESTRTRHSKDGIPNSDKTEHEEHLKEILELLKKEKLGIHVDPAKIESIKDWASPKTPTEICQFLGLAGYYRRFIEGFSKIAKSMTKLTQKGIKFDWGEKEENTFQLIKQKLRSAPILALPEGSEDFMVYCDASHKGLGVVSMQIEKERISKKRTKNEAKTTKPDTK
ncbi:putative reverse transcriptase domain-containing protein [Tanacetum coccineum]